MVYRIGLLVLLLSGLFGCVNVGINATRGSGNVITEPRSVSGLHSVVLAGIGDLQISQGDTEGLTIQAEDNLVPLITTEVTNGVLTIGVQAGQNNTSIVPTKPIVYNLAVKTLDAIALAGAGNITAPSLQADSLQINTSGAGNITVNQVASKQLTALLTGAGNLSLSGNAEAQNATLSGFGSYNAGELKTTTADIKITGAGSATVWATQTLNVQISGAGSINYYGDPQVSQSVTGIGSVKKLGSK